MLNERFSPISTHKHHYHKIILKQYIYPLFDLHYLCIVYKVFLL